MSDRAFRNEFNDYNNESYLDESTNKLISDFEKLIVSHLNVCIKRLDAAIESNHVDFTDTSVYTGVAGIAWTYFKYYQVTNDANYLNKAFSLLENHALKHSSRDKYSFLCGKVGALSIAAYLFHLTNNESERDNCIKEVLHYRSKVSINDSKMSNELLFGRVGYIYALLFIRNMISKQFVPDSVLIEIFNTVLNAGQSLASTLNIQSPLMFEWHDKQYFGAAHGISGILYILLKVVEEIPSLASTSYPLILPTIDFLTTCKYNSGNYQSSTGSTTDKLVQWCHGSPGIEFVMNLAYKATNNKLYKQEAELCGDITWQRGLLTKGYGLCHGVAGNAYTFLDLYHLTNDQKWLHRALMFAKWCTQCDTHETKIPDRPYSLYEGLCGTICFLIDIIHPKTAKFPGFQI